MGPRPWRVSVQVLATAVRGMVPFGEPVRHADTTALKEDPVSISVVQPRGCCNQKPGITARAGAQPAAWRATASAAAAISSRERR